MPALPSSGARPGASDLAAIARETHVFTFPLYEFCRVRYASILGPRNPQRTPLNQFLHRRQLLDAGARAVTTPNNDTLYSSAFLDLAPGPLVLEVPEIADRHYSLAFMDAYTNNFAYVGTRTTGGAAGRYLVAGPGWRGAAPPGMGAIAAPTNAVWLLGRILVAGAADLPRVHAVQDALKLAPAPGTPAAPAPSFVPPVADDPSSYFAVVNQALTENPPGARDAAAAARMRLLQVGAGEAFDATAFSGAERAAIEAGIAEAKRLVAAKDLEGKAVNGWGYPVRGIGNYGTDYLLRAAVALKVLAALEPEEAVYLRYVGARLDGSRAYRLRFPRGELPPVRGFWSLSLYEAMPDGRMFFADNPLQRYSIGDRTAGLAPNRDGSLDILIQHAAPRGGESNWLPAPAGPFALILRAYLPQAPLREERYAPPAPVAL